MRKHKFEFNSFAENTYLLWDEQTLEAAVIDPGMSDAVEEHDTQAIDQLNAAIDRFMR